MPPSEPDKYRHVVVLLQIHQGLELFPPAIPLTEDKTERTVSTGCQQIQFKFANKDWRVQLCSKVRSGEIAR